jgi:hypothetical protein
MMRDATWALGWRPDGAFAGLGGIGGSAAGLDQERGYALAYVTVAWTGTIAATPATTPSRRTGNTRARYGVGVGTTPPRAG